MDLARENFNIYQRLNAKNSSYNLIGHLRDYEKAQYYKKNYCKYPSIDFYRTRKSSSSFCSIFNYCTFNNYNNINNEFSNEFNKKKPNRTMLKNKSYSELNRTNKERQKKLNDIVKNHYELKYYYEDKNQNHNESSDNHENLNEKNQEKRKEEKIKEEKKEKQNYEYNDEFDYKDYNINENLENKKKDDKNKLENNKEDKDHNKKENKRIEEEKNEDLPLLIEILQYGKNDGVNEKIYTNRPLNDNNEKNKLKSNENEINKNQIKSNDKDEEIASDIIEDLDI